ncbi:MAG: YitT family protein [Clostridia bacterium]|nr:YitT family protein [Clostridia bacterium]
MKLREHVTQKALWRTARNIALTAVGTLILAIGVGGFIMPTGLVMGGVSGTAIIIEQLVGDAVPLTASFYASVLNWIFFFLGLIFLGKSFAAKTLVSTVVFPFALWIAERIISPDVFGGFFNLASERYASMGSLTLLVAAVVGGALLGVGAALTFLGGGSTGGGDILAFILCRFFKSLRSSVVIFITDATVIVCGMFVTKNFVISLLGIVCSVVATIMIDKVFLGESRAFIAHVISDRYADINEAVATRLERTTTLIEARGGYSGEEKKVLMVTFTRRQYAELTAILNSIDKNAFITVHRAHKIGGEGWSYEKGKRYKESHD